MPTFSASLRGRAAIASLGALAGFALAGCGGESITEGLDASADAHGDGSARDARGDDSRDSHRGDGPAGDGGAPEGAGRDTSIQHACSTAADCAPGEVCVTDVGGYPGSYVYTSRCAPNPCDAGPLTCGSGYHDYTTCAWQLCGGYPICDIFPPDSGSVRCSFPG